MKDFFKKRSNEWMLATVFIVLFIFMAVISPDRFLRWNNIQSMLYQMPEFGLIALGMMAIIVTGGINLSIVMTAAVSSILAAMVMSSSFTQGNPVIGIFLSVVICLVVAIVTGMLNGFIVAYIGVVPMLATLGTMIFFEGLSTGLTKGGAISGLPEQFAALGNKAILGIPYSLLIYIAAIVLTYLALERSSWGTELYMTGCNPTATRFSGVDTKKTLMIAYMFSALLSGFSALIMLSRYNSAKVDYGSSYQMQSIAAVVLGGTSINGGSGTVAGTVIAVAIIMIVSNGLNIFGVNRYVVDITTGAILLVVLVIRQFGSKIRLLNKKTKSVAAQKSI